MRNYSYTVLKYRHDAVAEEVLNVGVVLYMPDSGQVGIQYDPRYGRLSEAFAHFDGDLYKSVLNRLASALNAMARPLAEGLFQDEARAGIADVGALIRSAWPDQGLGYYAGPVFQGVTKDPEEELRELYDRFVVSQHDRRDARDRFDDKRLWDEFRKVLTPRGITTVLQPKTLGPAEVEFEHAYKNEKWHVIEPVSLDYADPSQIKQRALLVFGKAAAVRDAEELGSFTVIVGKPKRVDNDKPFLDAMRLLADLPVEPKQVIQEDQADKFADKLEQDMRRHGILE